MRRLPPAAGVLLVEAVLSAVVIAVGLVFISRGLGGQLAAARHVADRHTELTLLQSTLAELEAQPLSGLPLTAAMEGTCPPPHDASRWRMTAAPREDLIDAAGASPVSDVRVTVEREQPPSGAVTLTTRWPSEWFAGEGP